MKYQIAFFIVTFFSKMEVGFSSHFGHHSKNKAKFQVQLNSNSANAETKNLRILGGSIAPEGRFNSFNVN